MKPDFGSHPAQIQCPLPEFPISLKAAIDRLADREHQIINMRYFEGKTQMEVAEEIQISQAQVSRLEKKALREMKNYLA